MKNLASCSEPLEAEFLDRVRPHIRFDGSPARACHCSASKASKVYVLYQNSQTFNG
jgi:hypothetical protein